MNITAITKEHIYCYHDYTFFIFSRIGLLCNEKIVGWAWACGKARKPEDAPLEAIRKDSLYHHILIETLIENNKL